MTYQQYQDAKEKVIESFKKLNKEHEKHLTEGEINIMAESYLNDLGVNKPL